MEILILLGLILLNGAFAMSEIALLVARKARLVKLVSEGNHAASVALKLAEDPTKFLSTIQTGITLISILSGIVGEAVLAGPLSEWLQSFNLSETTATIGATAIVVILVTYVAIVLGELVPKRLAQINPEPIACRVARPMQILAIIARPFIILLSFSTHVLLKLMRIKQNGQVNVTEEDIWIMLSEGFETGAIEKRQYHMVRNVFRLDDRQLGSFMIPRLDVAFIDIELSPEENLHRLIESKHSYFPVCDGGLDKVLGIIHAKQVLISVAKKQTPDYSAHLDPCVYMLETMTGMDLLEEFRVNNIQMVFVIDEYGEIQGIVTLQDMLQAVLGEFSPPNADEAWAVQRDDGSWLLDGAISLPEMKDRLELKTVPEENKGRYHTLSGMILLLLGNVPSTGNHVDWEKWRFEVVDMDGKRIDKVLATPILLGTDEPKLMKGKHQN